MKNKRIAATGLCLVVGLGVWIGWLVWPTPHTGQTLPPTRTRTTINVTVCLLTGPGGATSRAATAADAAAWKGIQAAQTSTNLRAQQFPVTSAETKHNAQTAINTLALRGCGLIITTGSAENAAAASQAHLFPNVRFAPQNSPNPTTITADAKARSLALVDSSH
jgi:basic membrane lipoprotein Med (substrate-binding protein (PBP1-ABC) superfamily)